MFESGMTPDADRTVGAVLPLSLSEVARRIERRLAWYGLPRSGVCALELQGADCIVATVTVAGNGTFREEFDRRTGWVRRREILERVV